MVDTLVSGASASRRVGSTPIMGTIRKQRKNPWIFPLFSLDTKVGYGEKKKDKPSILKICPVWLPNLDLNQGPSD